MSTHIDKSMPKSNIEMNLVLPESYTPKLTLKETEEGIKLIKDTFESQLATNLNLTRVSAPLFLETGDGLQDDLAGLQTPVSFISTATQSKVEMVHSLAKWKRYSLYRYGLSAGTGLYTDMNAVRKDEFLSPIHSMYVDQWDWEKVITSEERNLDTLKNIVSLIFYSLKETENVVCDKLPLSKRLPDHIRFFHSHDLQTMYPSLSPRSREREMAKKYGAVFIIGIGHNLSGCNYPHDARADDYDDWSTVTHEVEGVPRRGLNGDIIVWDSVRNDALELSSMGIRVDASSLEYQMFLSGKRKMPFHHMVMDGTLPLSVGGGIGQSRVCMFLLHKAHIGEVQASVWPSYVTDVCKSRGVVIL